jgi:UDP-glucose 4-epimerase
VDDIVDALVRLLDEPAAAGEVFNLGAPAHEITIGELATMMIDKTGSASGIELIPYDEAYAAGFEDMIRRVPDTTKVWKLTGWQPMLSLDDILADAIADALREARLPAEVVRSGGTSATPLVADGIMDA